jgi:hypothetical protein
VNGTPGVLEKLNIQRPALVLDRKTPDEQGDM